MTSFIGHAVALSMLTGASESKRAHLGVVGFLRSPNMTVSSATALEGIIQAFQAPELSRMFATRLADALKGSEIGIDNAKHIAVVETILQNRDRLPREGFSIRTDLGDGASIESLIPPFSGSRSPTRVS